MKQLLIVLAVLTISAPVASSQVTTWTTLSATGTTAGLSVGGATLGADVHTVAVVVTGSPSGCTLNLDGSLDGSHWFNISQTGGSDVTCTSNVMFHVVNKLVAYVRGNLTALSGGTAPTVTITYLGKSSGGRQ